MSELPTLLRKNFVVPPKNSTEKQKEIIKNTISIDYILRKISDMIPHKPGHMPKEVPEHFGDKFLILKANTGSGKSTVLPAALYKTFFQYTNKNIIVTQPRILTAIDIPSTIVPFHPNLALGKNIGYNTGPFKQNMLESGIVFSTIGVLSQELITNTDEEFMKKYQFIIIDEVHERDIDTDKCLYLLKKLVVANYKNPNCPLVILMSATFNESIFIKYFEIPDRNFVQVIGSTFPITCNFTDYSIVDYIKYASLKAQKIHLDNLADFNDNNANCDIIIFVKDSGIGKNIYNDIHLFNSNILTKSDIEINAYRNANNVNINALFKTGGAIALEKKYYILPILLDTKSFSQGGLEYQNLFSNLDIISAPIWKVLTEPDADGNVAARIDMDSEPIYRVTPSRRIIISTNLAETGVTIPTLKYCIDTGYQLSSEFYPEYGCFSLIAKNISHGSAIQRKGRVGRKTPGQWYPCYTKETFNALPPEQLSSIIVNDTTDTLLSILIKEKNVSITQEYYASRIKDHVALGMFKMHTDQLLLGENWYTIKNELKTDISAIDFIELPSIQSLNHSVEKLHVLGFLDDNYDITVPGYFANQIKFISLDSRKMIMAGYNYGANILDLITIAALVHVQKRKIYGKQFVLKNFLKINDAEFTYYNTVIIGDDFITGLIMWNMLQKYITANISRNITLNTIKKYCTDNDLLYDGILRVIDMRNIIIENFIDIGLDPYYNSLGVKNYNLNDILVKSMDGLVEVKKIKQCIYEGYKCNILIHSNAKLYISLLKNVEISVKSPLLEEYKENNDEKLPRYIIVSMYTLQQKMDKAQFEFFSNNFVSVLDKFINVDEKFVKY